MQIEEVPPMVIVVGGKIKDDRNKGANIYDCVGKGDWCGGY